MAYFNTNIIARKGYAGRRMAKSSPAYSAMAHEIRHATSGMGAYSGGPGTPSYRHEYAHAKYGPGGTLSGILDDAWSAIKGGASSALDFYGSTEKQAGANAILVAQNQALAAQAAAQQQSGISTSTLLLLGGVGIGAFLLLRRK